MNAHLLRHFAIVFLFRHWLIAFLNAGLTASLGLALLWGASRSGWPRLSPLRYLRLQRLVILTAMTKAAFYLLRGTAARIKDGHAWAIGLQFPGPDQWVGLAPMSTHNIWHPTTATAWVSAILISAGISLLGWRGWQMFACQHKLRSLSTLKDSEQEIHLHVILTRAARALNIPDQKKLPQLMLVDLAYPTPFLLGLRQPLLLISPRLAISLSDLEMEMALRHELAHCLRRDQWWRWIQTWLEDVGHLSGLARFLSTRALYAEEEICDLMAVHTAPEALALGRAIVKASQGSSPTKAASIVSLSAVTPEATDKIRALPMIIPENVVPGLLGRYTRLWNEPSVLARRLRSLTAYAHGLSAGQRLQDSVPAPTKARSKTQCKPIFILLGQFWQGIGWLWFAILLLAILYAKVQIIFSHL